MAALLQSATIEPPATMAYRATPINHGRITMRTIEKRILVSDRVRHPPSEGFSWVDRRFLRDFAAKLSGNGVFLYLFLSAVSDKYGLSYYADSTISGRLRMREKTVAEAREELITHDLIVHQPPLTQVLSLPPNRLQGRPR
jgi:hypothetical protein